MISPENQVNAVAYAAELPSLRRKFPIGHYALFVEAAFIGAYATYSDALIQGYEHAGKQPFLVKQISIIGEEIHCVLTPFTTA